MRRGAIAEREFLKFLGGAVDTTGMRESHEGATPTTLSAYAEMSAADMVALWIRKVEIALHDGKRAHERERIECFADLVTASTEALHWARKAAE